MKSDGQIRILLLLRYLYQYASEENPVSTADILNYWNEHGVQAERKSVYADVAVLSDFGIDVIQIRGRTNQYFIGNRLLELPELKLLIDAVESSRFITRKKSERLLSKLAALTSASHAAELERPVYMDGTSKADNEAAWLVVDAIHTAIRERKKIQFQYTDYTPQKEKILRHDGAWYFFSPYALMWNQDFYYVVGHSERHGKLSQFRVDRMTKAEVLAEDAVETPGFDPTYYASKVFGMFDDFTERVTLLCENEFMRSVIDRFGTGVKTQVTDEGHFIAVVEVAPSPPFFAWVFTFGGGIRIIEPAHVLDEMRGMAAWLY